MLKDSRPPSGRSRPRLSRGNGVSGSVVTVVRADGPGRPSAMTEVTRILAAIDQGDRAGRRATPPAGLQRAAQAGGRKADAAKLGADARRHGPGPRGIPAAGRSRRLPTLERPRPLLRSRGPGHAPHPRRQRPPQAGPESAAQASQRQPLDAVATPEIERRDRWPSTRHCESWPRPTPSRPAWSSCAYFAGLTGEQAAKVLDISPCHGRPPLGLRQGLAAERGPWPVIPCDPRSFLRIRDAFAGRFALLLLETMASEPGEPR